MATAQDLLEEIKKRNKGFLDRSLAESTFVRPSTMDFSLSKDIAQMGLIKKAEEARKRAEEEARKAREQAQLAATRRLGLQGGGAGAPYSGSGSSILDLQRQLNAKGAGLAEDGILGPLTRAAAKRYGMAIPSGGGGRSGGNYVTDSGSGNFESWLNEIARIAGLTPSEKAAMRTISKYEGGFKNIPQRINDINTRKGTPAFGPWQVIEPTFRSNMWRGYGNWKNPVHSGLAAINYMRRRYGGIEPVARRFVRQGKGGY